MIGLTALLGRMFSRRASRMPGTARIVPMLSPPPDWARGNEHSLRTADGFDHSRSRFVLGSACEAQPSSRGS